MRIYTVFKKGINDKKNPEDYWGQEKREKLVGESSINIKKWGVNSKIK